MIKNSLQYFDVKGGHHNRVQKYRVYLPEYESIENVCSIDYEHELIHYHGAFHGYCHFNECVLLQFTGLYDEHGTEIYEGDKLRLKIMPKHGIRKTHSFTYIGIVVFDQGAFRVVNEVGIKTKRNYLSGCKFKGMRLVLSEVVGSRYDKIVFEKRGN